MGNTRSETSTRRTERASLVTRRPTSAAHAEALAVTARIRDNLEQAARSFWDIGNDLARVRQQKLYEHLGYETFDDYVAGELKVRLRQVQKMLTVARMYARDDAASLGGIERSSALIAYCRQLPGRPDPGALVRADAEVDGRPLSACDTDAIVAATRRLKHERALRRARRPSEREKARDAKEALALVSAFVKASKLGRAKVTLHRNEIVLRFNRAAFLRRIED